MKLLPEIRAKPLPPTDLEARLRRVGGRPADTEAAAAAAEKSKAGARLPPPHAPIEITGRAWELARLPASEGPRGDRPAAPPSPKTLAPMQLPLLVLPPRVRRGFGETSPRWE